MPCWTVKSTKVNPGSMDMKVLEAGLKAAGYATRMDGESLAFSKNGSYLYHSFTKGELTISGENVEEVVGEIKRSYAAECVRRAAARYGWNLKESKTEKTVSFSATSRR